MKKKDRNRAPKRDEPRESRRDDARKGPRSLKRSSIVSPRDERGTPYRGDFPNPLRGTIRDCF